MSKARNMARMGQDTSAGYTGAFDMPAGTTAERPASAGLGWTRLNTDTGSVEVYDGTNWNAVTRPFVSSVTGNIYAGLASNLVISGQNFTSTITVRFSEGGSTVADVTGVSVSAGSATVAVPAAVYGQTVGDTIDVRVINSDGTLSANQIAKSVVALPTGGTITTSGSYRIHTFTSSSSFVVPANLTLSNVEYLVVAGGAGGGSRYYGGGGGGGYDVNRDGVAGGSGGGAGKLTGGTNNQGTAGSGVSGQGYVGGGNNGATIANGSGGGGAGSVGRDGTTGSPYGTGGNGVTSSITGSSTTRAGGGAGATDVNNTPSGVVVAGGTGGGGNSAGYSGGTWGSGPVAATAGGTNTGGGGGAGIHDTGTITANGAAGGSGIVIVRYQLT